MESISRAEQLAGLGRYREALEILDAVPRRESRQHDVFRAELCEIAGRHAAAQEIVNSLLAIKGLSDLERGRAEFVQSRLSSEIGDFDSELHHLQRAINHSERAKDLKSVCGSQFRLLALVADRSGLDSARTLFGQVRLNVTKLGDPAASAALHLFVSELDGKRGLLSSALKHTMISKRLLQANRHIWLEAWTFNNLLAFAILRSDFDAAIDYGKTALELSNECGAVAARRRALGNLGRLHFCRGDFEAALWHLDQALRLSSSSNEHMNGTLDSIARTYLSQGKIEEGLDLIARIEANTQAPQGTGRYVHRHSLLTKAELLLSNGLYADAFDCLQRVQELASQAGDRVLLESARLLAEESACFDGHNPTPIISRPSCSSTSELSPLRQRVLAVSLAREGNLQDGREHIDRALRVTAAVGDVPTQLELERAWARATAMTDSVRAGEQKVSGVSIHSIETLLVHAGQPEIVAAELIAMIAQLQCAIGAVVVAREQHGGETDIAATGRRPQGPDVRTFPIGVARQRTLELRVQPRPELEAHATVSSLTMLLGIVNELVTARAEREQRLTLWPIEEWPLGDDSVVMGKMEELMSQARRIATANVPVLITGESGTGKEVLARAIHAYSSRSRKPFVAFNCTAVARDLVETHLFGHRRGAFTGADRDAPGLVRSAKDGTLFLDEVGEMSADMQPKLLRFLESGEIHPLGDSSPFTVDVRIIAATNADLDTLVQQGRLREDLYYRLNVVRLTIPPLRERRDEIPALVHHFIAKACTAYGKERVRVSDEMMEQLILFSWPGNVRQLQNEIRRIVAMADSDTVLQASLLSHAIRQEAELAATGTPAVGDMAVVFSEKLGPTLSRIERERIKAALLASNGKLEAAAKALGISRKGLYLKRQRLGL